MPDTGIGVVITGKEVYDAVMETKATVTRIEGKFSSLEATVKEHETKIEDLQRFKYQLIGWSGLAGTLAGLFGPYVVKMIFGG